MEMVNAISIRECFRRGFDNGWNSASWVDLPEIGTEMPREIDYIGMGPIETETDQLEAWETLAHEGESNSRQYSPFEFTAAAINARDEKYGEGESSNGWEAYENGIRAAINKQRRKRFPLNNKRKWK